MNPERILIRMPNWVGDFIMVLPAAEILRKTYPNAEITWIARPYLYDLAFFRKDLFDEFIPFHDKETLPRLFLFGRSLKKKNFSRAFLFTRHFRAAFISRAARIPEIIGYSQSWLAFLLTHRSRRPDRHQTRMHDTGVYLNLLSQYGLAVPSQAEPSLNIDTATIEKTEAQFLPDHSSPSLFIHAGAATSAAKLWMPSRFAQIINSYIQHTGGTAVLLGIESESGINNEIMKTVDKPDSVVNLVGKTTLKQTCALLANAELLLSNDSGMMHVAGALDTPAVVVFGPTNPNQVMPSNRGSVAMFEEVDCGPCHKKICPLDHRCMIQLTADRVWEQGIAPLLKSHCRL